MSKILCKYIAVFDYFDKSSIALSATSSAFLLIYLIVLLVHTSD